MADIATLGIRVTNAGVKEAERSLDDLAKTGARAERATESLSRELQQQDGLFKRSASSIKSVGAAIAALGAAYASSQVFGRIIANTIEQERVTAQLNATLRSTGRLTPELSQNLQGYAASLQQVTNFGDEAVIGAQALLLTFTQIGGEEFNRATRAILDVSTALNVDLKQATLQVGKALNDPIRGVSALAESGIQFTQSQRDLIKSLVETNRVADAQKIILAELETQFGGSAEAARNTLGGAIQSLQNAFNDLLEGPAGGDGVRGTTKAINDLTAVLNSPEIKAGFGAIVQGSLDALGALASFAATTANVTAFTGEELAARIGGPSLDDVVRVEEAIQRSQQIIADGAVAGIPLSETLLQQEREKLAKLQSQLEVARQLTAEREKQAKTPAQVGDFIVPVVAAAGAGGPSAADRNRAEREAAAAARRLAAEEERLARQKEQEALKQAAANDRFVSSLEDVQALLAGPLAQAELQHIRNLEQIEETGRRAGVSSELIAKAKSLETERYEQEAAAIREREDVAGQLIRDLEFELSLIGLTNAEREKAIALRQLEGKATAEQAQRIGELIDATERSRKAQAAFESFKGEATDAFASFIDGSKSATDALNDFAQSITRIVARLLAEKAIEAIFGAALGGGTSGGGAAQGGNIFASIIGALFGGGSAKGNAFAAGNVIPFRRGGVVDRTTPFGMSGGRFGIMGEAGPEAILPLYRGRDGKLGVRMADGGFGGAGGGTQQLTSNLTVNVQGRIDRRTQDQIAAESSRRLRVAARNA